MTPSWGQIWLHISKGAWRQGPGVIAKRLQDPGLTPGSKTWPGHKSLGPNHLPPAASPQPLWRQDGMDLTKNTFYPSHVVLDSV